jgi:hypothetical protein
MQPGSGGPKSVLRNAACAFFLALTVRHASPATNASHRLDLIERDFLDLSVRVRAWTNYASVLASLPEELRRAYPDGDFSVGIRDADFQVIPTVWVLAAEARWKPTGAWALNDRDGSQSCRRWTR